MPVREATKADLSELVSAHVAAFPGFFLTRLGSKFLSELYSGFLQDPSGVLLVAGDDRRIAGFVAGTTTPDGFFRKLLRRRGAAFVSAAASALACAPIDIGTRLLRAVTYRGERPVSLTDAALLSSVGVRPEMTGEGVGQSLVESFCREATARGSRYVYLTTDRDDNVAPNRFYESCGFVLESSFRRGGDRWMNRYVRTMC